MPRPMEIDIVPEHASIRTARSRMSITATIRRKTSRLFGNDVTDAADNRSQSIRGPPLRTKRSWFNSVGVRFARQDGFALDVQESSQDAQVALREKARTTDTSSPSSDDSHARSSTGRRLFSGLQTLPAKFRRGGAALLGRSSSSSLSDEGRENMPMLTVSPARLPDTGSLSSFRIGVQKAVREIVDDNFRFSDDDGMRSELVKLVDGTARLTYPQAYPRRGRLLECLSGPSGRSCLLIHPSQ
ncbi:uncharacterized protein B0T15DRAFT_317422 [Chaetomium strumarium]|uniref:Uncharacterized protein n=1 Tax=Chaetomium strumarium TaxID=1170767 RepID=A0AAJ0LXU2_9PEZI|nr:hypothetical protein B0T15DRAFT_317422 [Chaetomium strumarium]